MSLKIHSIETFGTHEGPGIRLVVFMQGCNFRCLYCHNPDTISAKGGREVSDEEIIKTLENGRNFYYEKGGLTVSGGEPTLQAKSLISLFQKVKKLGYHTALDTNGSIWNDDVKELFEYTDLVLLDVKQIDSDKHFDLTGQTNSKTLKLAEYLEKNDRKFWIRYVLVPGYTNSEKDLENFAKHFEKYKNLQRVEILPYHTLGVYKYKELGLKYGLKGVKTPSELEITEAKSIFEKYLQKVVVR